MTMLDRARRHKNWLKWSLAVVVLTFVPSSSFPIWSRPLRRHECRRAKSLPRSTGHHRDRWRLQQRYVSHPCVRQQFGGSLNDQLLRQLASDQQIPSLDDRRAGCLTEAEQNGITVTGGTRGRVSQIFSIPVSPPAPDRRRERPLESFRFYQIISQGSGRTPASKASRRGLL